MPIRVVAVVAVVAVAGAVGVFFVLRGHTRAACKGVGVSAPIDAYEPAGDPSPEAAAIRAARAGLVWPRQLTVPPDGWVRDGQRVSHELPTGSTFYVDVRQTGSGDWVAGGEEAICS